MEGSGSISKGNVAAYKEHIGYGEIVKDDKGNYYVGNLPFDDGDEVMIMKMSDFMLLVENDERFLVAAGKPMEPEHYDPKDYDFTDELVYVAADGTRHRLFLDHKFYGHNFKDAIWVRYVSVDEAFVEEAERFKQEV